MPRVPTYDNLQTQIRPLPGVRQSSAVTPASLAAPGAQIQDAGRALQNAAAGAGAVLAQMQDRQNADMLFRATTAAQDEYLAFESAARERRGQQAWGLTGEADKWWKDTAAKHGASLENDVQRTLFSQQIGKLRASSLDQLAGYESNERRASLEASTQASIVSSTNLAAANAADGRLVASTKADVLKRTQVLADLNGWSPEVRAAKESEFLTNFHKQIIQAQVDQAPAAAREYFAANKAEIAGAQHAEIDKVLRVGGLRITAQTAADEAEALGLSESAALAAARKQFSGEDEAAVVAEIKARYAERNAISERDQRTAADDAFGIYARTGSLSAVPASTLARMDGRTLLALKKQAESDATGVDKTATNWDTYYTLRQQALAEPAAFAREDLRKYFPELGKAERESLIDLQGKVKKPEDLKDVATLEQQLSNTHDALGWASGDRERKGRFDQAVLAAIDAEERRTGKKLGYEDRQRVIDRLVIDGRIRDSGLVFDTRGQLFEFVGTEDEARFTPKIPDTERAKIEAALQRAGRPVTDAEVMRLFKQKHRLP